MKVDQITPVLNVTDIAATFAWFESWGWMKRWEWGTPPSFGAVSAGSELQIFFAWTRRGVAAKA